MYCSKCGTQNNENNKYCQNCGEILPNNNFSNMTDTTNNIYNTYQTHNEQNYYRNEKLSGKLGIASLVLGIISLFTCILFFISIPLGIVGLILGISCKLKNGVCKAGIVLNIIGLCFAVLFIVFGMIASNTYKNTYSEYDTSNVSDDNTIHDDILYESLDNLRNWNRYSDLRSGELGKIKSINGGWRVLSDSEAYWKFENEQFWWYKSVNDLNDNYWHGTTQILTGKEGLSVAGIPEDRLDLLISNSSGKVTADDVYTIVWTPTTLISEGVDKSDTNIPDGATFTYVWILVDHGTEGIEAQVLNTENYDISYFVKIAD